MIKHVASMLVVIAGLVTGSQVHASTTALFSLSGNMCVGVDDSVPGSFARQSECDGAASRQWNVQVVTFGLAGAPVVRFINAQNGLCLDSANGPNAGITQSACSQSRTQLWQIDSPYPANPALKVAVSRQIRAIDGNCLNGSLYPPGTGIYRNVNTTVCAGPESQEQSWYVDVF